MKKYARIAGAPLKLTR
jgi:hypothetical protein